MVTAGGRLLAAPATIRRTTIRHIAMKALTRIHLPAGRTALWLAAVAACLVVLHVAAMQIYYNPDLGFSEAEWLHFWHVSMFDLDNEDAFGTWFSAVTLIFTGQLLLLHAAAVRETEDRWYPWWFVLGLGFHVLSIDEVAGMHELLNTFLRAMDEPSVWTDVALAGIAVLACAYLPFLRALRQRTAWLFSIAGLIYLGGAVGVERWTGEDVNSLHYNMWTTVEEGLEMAGVIVMIYAVLAHMRGTSGDVLVLGLDTGDSSTLPSRHDVPIQ